ncbi:MAG: alpha/beta hydrolase [Dehalococcoidia bacterium]
MPLMDLGDATIHYEDRGSGPLTFIHCHDMGSSGERFEADDMDWYAQRFRTISWDNRGLGRSGQSAKYTLPLYAADMAHLLDRLGVERAIVMGVSWGGILVQRFAIDYPERCLALIVDSSSPETNAAASENWYLRAEAARIGAKAVIGRELSPAFEGHAVITPEQADEAHARVKPEHLDSYVAQYRATAGLHEHPLTPYLHRITCPTLAVAGGKDATAGAGGAVVISRNVPNARLHIFQDAGHGTSRTARAEFRTLLLDFLGENGLPV